jgi:phosphohistidine phosphatase
VSPTEAQSVVKILYLIRHADAGDPSEWTGPDAERPLSGKGVKQAARLAATLLAAETQIDSIRHSPARRCAETATVLSAVLEVESAADERLGNGPTLSDLDRMFNRKGVKRLALVGHEPSLSRLVAELTGTSGIAVEKGALIRIDLPNGPGAGAGRLVTIAPPSLLRAPKDER